MSLAFSTCQVFSKTYPSLSNNIEKGSVPSIFIRCKWKSDTKIKQFCGFGIRDIYTET